MLVEHIWPAFCIECAKPGNYICNRCFRLKVQVNYQQYCHVCGVEARRQPVHNNCIDLTDLDGVFIGYDYSGVIEKALKGIKYQGHYALAGELIKHLKSDLVDWLDAVQPEVLTWVPTARKRRWARGFNQSKLFASKVAAVSSIDLQNTLVRRDYKHSQVGSSAEERRQNVKDSFVIKSETQMPESVVIVDDVMTTGATLEVCANKLKDAGVARVFGLVMARNRPVNKEDML